MPLRHWQQPGFNDIAAEKCIEEQDKKTKWE